MTTSAQLRALVQSFADGDNGGQVPTCAIGASSPARDAGTTTVPAGVDISTDARGMLRCDGKPDIGAFEVQ